MVSIIKADKNDFKIIAAIGRVSVEEAHRDSCSTEDMSSYIEHHYNDTAIIAELNNNDNLYYIIKHNGIPIGFSKLVLNEEHPQIDQKNVTKLDRIYLLKSYQDLKLGYELLQFNIKICRQYLQSGIWLYTWVENTKALRFYLKNGFVIIGTAEFKITETRYNPLHHMFLDFTTLPGNEIS